MFFLTLCSILTIKRYNRIIIIISFNSILSDYFYYLPVLFCFMYLDLLFP